jgi:hypothetical protein
LLAIAALRIDSKLAADVGEGVGDTTGAGVDKTTGTGVGDGVGVCVTTEVGVGVGFGLAATFTPLFQTSLFPDLMQVYLIPLTVEVEFSFGQESPALTAALAIFTFSGSNKMVEQRTARNEFLLLIGKY